MTASVFNFCLGPVDSLSAAVAAASLVFGALAGMFLMLYRDINLQRNWIASILIANERDFAVSEKLLHFGRYQFEKMYRSSWELKLAALSFAIGGLMLITLIILIPFSPVGAVGQIILVIVGVISGSLLERGLWLIGQSGVIEIRENRFDIFYDSER
jgi:hypothetical protein